MFINPYFYIALPAGLFFFFLGRYLGSKLSGNTTAKKLSHILMASALLPAVLFSASHLKIFDDSILYAEFRSLNGIEILSSLAGASLGYFSSVIEQNRKFYAAFLLAAVAAISIPFLKPLVLPAEMHGEIKDVWKDNACIQTAGTCGPASLATILYRYGEINSEKAIAKTCYSSATGTEIWYLARYARRKGYKVRFFLVEDISKCPFPSIIGTRGKFGHFIALLDRKNGMIALSDPQNGIMTIDDLSFRDHYKKTGLSILITK